MYILLGGTFGLFCGFSFMGAAEIVYWCFKAIFRVRQSKQDSKETCLLAREYLNTSSLHGLKYIENVTLIIMETKDIHFRKQVFLLRQVSENSEIKNTIISRGSKFPNTPISKINSIFTVSPANMTATK